MAFDINSSRYQYWFIQQQTNYTQFNTTANSWNNSGAQFLRVDANSVTVNREAPYNRFPVLTGTKSEVAGIRGRKRATWSIRGLPLIPSGSSSTAPDTDIIWQNIFGAAATGSPKTYSFTDTGLLPFSMFGFNRNWSVGTPFTEVALWGCMVSRATINFNGNFLTCDLDGFAGYQIDSTGFNNFAADGGLAGLNSFPTAPTSTPTNGQPITGFGNGYSLTLNSQVFSLQVRALSLTIETGWSPIDDVIDSPYTITSVGGSRRITIATSDILDTDNAALINLKQQADSDLTGATAFAGTIVAGGTTGNTFTWTLNQIQPEAFQMRDNGPAVAFVLPASAAHATAVGQTNDLTFSFS